MPKLQDFEDGSANQVFDGLTGADIGQLEQRYDPAVDVDAIQPHPDNPNVGDINLIAESIRTNSWYGAVIVQESTGYILAGEHRWRAAKQEGALHIPVIYKDVDDVTAIRIMLADNETARAAEYDQAVLDQLLNQLAPIDADNRVESLVGTGFRLETLQQFEAAREAEAAEEEAARVARDSEKAAHDAAVKRRTDAVAPTADDVPDDSGKTATEYGLLIVCTDEAHQERVYQQLRELDPELVVRVVAV